MCFINKGKNIEKFCPKWYLKYISFPAVGLNGTS